jgi:hypothetical protein
MISNAVREHKLLVLHVRKMLFYSTVPCCKYSGPARHGDQFVKYIIDCSTAPLAMEEAVLVEEGDTVGQVEVVSVGIPHHDLLHAGSDVSISCSKLPEQAFLV